MKLDTLLEARIRQELRGAHSGQKDLSLIAYKGNEVAGQLDYAEFRSEVYVQMIQTGEQFRRQGIATELLKHLDKLYPDTEIDYGMLTGEGAALVKAYQRKHPKKIDFEQGFKNKDFLLSFLDKADYQVHMAFDDAGIDLRDYDLKYQPDVERFYKDIRKIKEEQWAKGAKQLRSSLGIRFNKEAR